MSPHNPPVNHGGRPCGDSSLLPPPSSLQKDVVPGGEGERIVPRRASHGALRCPLTTRLSTTGGGRAGTPPSSLLPPPSSLQKDVVPGGEGSVPFRGAPVMARCDVSPSKTVDTRAPTPHRRAREAARRHHITPSPVAGEGSGVRGSVSFRGAPVMARCDVPSQPACQPRGEAVRGLLPPPYRRT